MDHMYEIFKEWATHEKSYEWATQENPQVYLCVTYEKSQEWEIRVVHGSLFLDPTRDYRQKV